MALFKYGVFSAERPPRFYAALIAAAVAVGLPLQAYGIALDFARGWPIWSFFVGVQFIYWPGIAVSLSATSAWSCWLAGGRRFIG